MKTHLRLFFPHVLLPLSKSLQNHYTGRYREYSCELLQKFYLIQITSNNIRDVTMLQEAQAFQWYDTHGCHLQYNSTMPIHHGISCPDSATLSHLSVFVPKRKYLLTVPKLLFNWLSIVPSPHDLTM